MLKVHINVLSSSLLEDFLICRTFVRVACAQSMVIVQSDAFRGSRSGPSQIGLLRRFVVDADRIDDRKGWEFAGEFIPCLESSVRCSKCLLDAGLR